MKTALPLGVEHDARLTDRQIAKNESADLIVDDGLMSARLFKLEGMQSTCGGVHGFLNSTTCLLSVPPSTKYQDLCHQLEVAISCAFFKAH